MSPLDKEPVPEASAVPQFTRNPNRGFGTLEPVPPGAPGELLVTRSSFQKATGRTGGTATSYAEIDGKTWYRMKDFVRMDEAGSSLCRQECGHHQVQGYRCPVLRSKPCSRPPGPWWEPAWWESLIRRWGKGSRDRGVKEDVRG